MKSMARSKERRNRWLQSRVAETPSRQEIFDVLRNQRRQHIIRYVEQNGTNRPFELSDLVDYVTAREPGTAENGNSPTERKRVYNTLRQTHLPKLDEMGILDYDPKTNRIAFTESAADARLYLERAPGNDTPWYAYYLGLSIVAVVVVTADWFGVYPFDLVSTGAVGAAVLVSFAMFGIAQIVDIQSD